MMPLLAMAAMAACYMVDGSRIQGSDLAAASPAFAMIPPESEIGYAPLPGARRVMETAELVRLAARFSVDAAGSPAICFERRTAEPDPGKLMQAMRTSLKSPDARIEIVEFLRRPAPAGDVDFPLSGLMAPAAGRDTALWNGNVRYDGGRFPIWARVRIAVREQVVVAVEALKPGRVIEAADVKLDQIETFPRRYPMVSQLEAVVGRVPRRAIPAGTPILPDALDEPIQVAKGDTVQVEVRSGAALLRLEARAESAGRRGQTIPIRNLDSGKVFRARVQDKGQVVMECQSGN